MTFSHPYAGAMPSILSPSRPLAMSAPLYMLMVVNERVRFGAPLGYFTADYLENIVRNNSVRLDINA